MKRKDFIKIMSLIPISGFAMKLNDLHNLSMGLSSTPLMPAIFFGHGSPMNAIELNEFSQTWRDVIKNVPTPNAILCISAHWETKGTKVTTVPNPPTIHDFGGFPQALFDVQYPAISSPELIAETKKAITLAHVEDDKEWGLDHGTWSVLNHLYPEANIPVVQLSLDFTIKEEQHYAIAAQLLELRKKGFLIIGSGNMVHNLRLVDWKNPDGGFDWAEEANALFKQKITSKDHKALLDYRQLGNAVKLSIPSPEHYRPLLYILALQQEKENPSFFNDKAMMGSISMTGVIIS